MQLVYIREVILKRASPLFFNGHRLSAGVAGRVSRLRMTSANVDRIMTLRGRAGR